MGTFFVYIIACLITYLVGSIPFGFLAAKWRGIDISQVGSGNIGATNVARSLGWKIGALVGVLDFCKGFFAVYLALFLFLQDWHIWQMLSIALFSVIGHIFPIWLKFKGGKGVATIFGILAGFFGILYFLIFLLVWILAVKQIKLMSLVNLVTALLIPIAFWIKYNDLAFILFGLLLCVIIWWRHSENIKRLLAGEEHSIKL
jgi:glycerol-3-phosphate acyltransferase PlsY